MKVHLIKENTIRKYIARHSGSKVSFEEMLSRIKLADWRIPGDIKNTFPLFAGLAHIQSMTNWAKKANNTRSIFIKFLIMESLKYKIITSGKQYNEYCKILESLVFSTAKTKEIKDEIALLTLLIGKYDEEHYKTELPDPITLIRSLMKDHKMKAVDLAKLLNVSESLVSDILHYKKGLSKDTIRILSEKFKLRQEAFNRPYELKVPVVPKIPNARIMNTKKDLAIA